MRIGLIGTGAIGRSISDAILGGGIKNAEVKIIGDINDTPILRSMASTHKCRYTTDCHEFNDLHLDIVVEAASQQAVLEYAEYFLSKGISMMVMSIGALVDEDYYHRLTELAEKNNCSIYIPSGAVGAMDILKAAKITGIDSVTLTTRKPPNGFGMECLEPTVLYDGTAREAVKKFPKNINVSMILSLAGIGPDNTKVRIIADPFVNKNIHEIEVSGVFGYYKLQVANVPSPENPKTSYLACLSAIALLKELSGQRVHIGT